MTQYQPPFQPDYRGYVPPVSLRPASVTALSIISIVLGSIGLLCGGFSLITQVLLIVGDGKNPFMSTAPAMTNQSLNIFNAIASFVMLIFSGLLLGGGIVGLKLKPIARRMMIWVSIAMILWATLQLIVGLSWGIPAATEQIKQTQSQMDAQTAKMMSSIMGPMQIVIAFVVWIFWLILPALFLIFWRSPKVVSAFETGGVVPGSNMPPPFSGPQYPPTGGYSC